MPGHKVATREEWKAAADAVHERERELGKLDEEIAKQRQEVPWVRVDKEYTFDTEDGIKTLPELFDGRSQLLVYQLPSCVPWLYGPGGPFRRCSPARQSTRHHPDRDLTRADREAERLQTADGLEVPVRVLVRE